MRFKARGLTNAEKKEATVPFGLATDVDNSNNSLLIIDETRAEGNHLVLPQWLHLIRVGCTMLSDMWDKIMSGPANALVAAWMTELDIDDSELPYLDYFLSVIPEDSSWSNASISIYRRAATMLAESFAYLEKEKITSGVSTWNILGAWPVRVETEYMTLLSERHPGALILSRTTACS